MIRRGGVTDVPWFWDGWKCSVSYLFNTSPGCNYDSAIAELRVLASHTTHFEYVSQGAWELVSCQLGSAIF